mgnify:CR=1 FL=1
MKRILFIASVVAGLFAGMTANAQKDARTREYITPVRVVWTNSTDLISNPDALLQEGNGQADFMERTFCDMKSTRKVHPAIILDFGKELHGGLQIVTGMGSDHNVRVRVRFGESVSETMSEIDGKNGAKNDHAIRDQEVLLPWFGVKEIGNSGFRFVRIDLISDNKELSLKEVRAIALYRDVPYRGAFKSNDERLNQIWQTGAYTVHQCMQEFLWDGIKRDRLVWMGDMHPEIMTISNVFGYNEVVPKSLDLARDSTPLPGWMNGMYPYSMWWVLAQRDWYWFNGDKAYLEQQREYLLGLLELFHKRVDEKGFELSGGDFLDWPSEENEPAGALGDIKLSQTYVSIPADGGLSEITVQANADWAFNAEEIPDWLTVSQLEGAAGETKVTFAAEAFEGGREVELKIAVGSNTQFLMVRQGTAKAVNSLGEAPKAKQRTYSVTPLVVDESKAIKRIVPEQKHDNSEEAYHARVQALFEKIYGVEFPAK